MKENSNIVTSEEKRLVLRAEVEKELRSRAYKDEAFRLELLANPRAVLERDYPHWFPGGKIPKSLSIKINEEEEQTWNLFLPPKSFHPFSEVSQEDLEVVAAGAGLSQLRDIASDTKNIFRNDRSTKTTDSCTDKDTVTDSCCSRRMGL